MSAHGVIDEFEQRRAIVAAAFFVILGLEAPQIGDKVRLPHPASLDLRQIAPASVAPLIGAAVCNDR